MPLLDHFHAPLAPRYPWQSFHAAWASAIMERLNSTLPARYLAFNHVRLGTQVEADVAEFDSPGVQSSSGNGGGVALATWAPPAATAVMPALFPDDIEVQVVDTRDGATVVAVVELVSPANEDRDESRDSFVEKCAAYLQRGIGLVVVDIVTAGLANLHDLLVERIHRSDEFFMPDAPALHTAAYRPARHDASSVIELWHEALHVGQPLPTMPLPLRGAGCVPLELEATYTRARQMSRL